MPVSSADSSVADWAVEGRNIWDRTQDAIRASKERMRSSADIHRRPAPTFAPGDLVWLSARNIRLRVESTKFAPRYLGPFKVLEQVNPVVYCLALPPRLGITDTFHVSLLKPVYLSRFSESSAGTSGLSTDNYEVDDYKHITQMFNLLISCRYTKMKTATNIYIFNLALADALATSTLPFQSAKYLMETWPFGEILCKIVLSIDYYNMFTSIFTLTMMSVDRYIAVCHPVRALDFRTPSKAKAINVCIWILSSVIGVPIMVMAVTKINKGK
ncbi:unnamed protein product [Ranitomeya imitator]|uniref:G-protein coupled receptors family 1 profile domain-containing protein n=1 Tax=Ranitomeya imitator TaxID=111125 RepID=A0ABN9LL09_9NEOB|nr:unnamed protein product [Ranitomeya imitator]